MRSGTIGFALHLLALESAAKPTVSSMTSRSPNDPPAMDKVFDVLATPPAGQEGSCARYVSGPGGKADESLDNMWKHAFEMLTSSRPALTTAGRYVRAPNLRRTMLAIDGNSPLSGAMVQYAASVLTKMDGHMSTLASRTTDKPVFTCGSGWLTYMPINTMVEVDADGQLVVASTSSLRPKVALKYYLSKSKGVQEPDDWWWFLGKSAGLPAKLTALSKTKYPATHNGGIPFLPNPSRGNQPDPCYRQPDGAYVLIAPGEEGGTPFLMACMDSLPATSGPADTALEAGMSIDAESMPNLVAAKTLFRALLELSDVDGHFVKRSTKLRLQAGIAVSSQYLHKSDFDEDPTAVASSFGDVCTLALYDLAEPREQTVQQKLAIHNVDSYAWFALGAYLQSVTQLDWSTGTAFQPGRGTRRPQG